MSSPTQNPPMMTLYPSPQERLDSYIAAIRLASSARNSMDAQKADVDSEKIAPLADSYGRHHPNVPPQLPAKTTIQGGREPELKLNQTASAHFAPNTTKPGFVRSPDGNPSPGHSVSEAVNPTGATLEALKRHQGFFPPPDPSMTTGDDSLLEDTAAKREVPKQHNGYFPPPDPSMTTSKDSILEDTAADTPTGIKPEALEQHNGYFPPPDPPIASPHLHTEGLSISHILAPRDTDACEAPTGFKERLACAGPTFDFFLVVLFALFFIRVSVFLCLTRRQYRFPGRKRDGNRHVDEEKGTAAWPRVSTTTDGFESERKKARVLSQISTATDGSEATLREERSTSIGGLRLDEGVSAEEYEPVAWRSRYYRAERAHGVGGGRVVSDAGPVTALPGLGEEVRACSW